MSPSSRTLCIGIDVAWWGGLDSNRASQADHFWSAWIAADGLISGLSHTRVNLEEANVAGSSDARDRFGARLLSEIDPFIESVGVDERMLIALDAPLEAFPRQNELPQKKVYARGEKSGRERRQCERCLVSHFKALPRGWAADLKVQSGSPIVPRVQAIVAGLCQRGFKLAAPGRATTARDLVEIFPSASIAVLGTEGCYGSCQSADVRLYKSKDARPFTSTASAIDCAKAPLLGFEPHLGRQIYEIAAQIAEKASHFVRWKDGNGKRNKAYDDPIDAGIALLTGACFVQGGFQWFGDGTDGAILAPSSHAASLTRGFTQQ